VHIVLTNWSPDEAPVAPCASILYEGVTLLASSRSPAALLVAIEEASQRLRA
jgi:hypothetical protein